MEGEHFSELQVRQLLRLCRRLHEEPDAASRKHRLLATLCRMVGAVTAMATVLRDDFTVGEELTVVRVSTKAGKCKEQFTDIDLRSASGEAGSSGEIFSRDNPMVRPFIHSLGQRLFEPTAFARREIVSDEDWYTSEFYRRFRQPMGLDDCILSAVPLPQMQPFVALLCLSGPQLHNEGEFRAPGSAAFTSEDRRLVQFAHAELRWLYYPQIGASTPAEIPVEPAGPTEPLPARHQRVLLRILAGDSEKAAAEHLGLSPYSVHEYVKKIYRKLGVASRAELMAQLY